MAQDETDRDDAPWLRGNGNLVPLRYLVLARDLEERLEALVRLPNGSRIKAMLFATDLDPAKALIGTDLSGHNFGEQDLRGVNLTGCDLTGADLSRILFDFDTHLEAANLTKAKLPYAWGPTQPPPTDALRQIGQHFDSWLARHLLKFETPNDVLNQLTMIGAAIDTEIWYTAARTEPYIAEAMKFARFSLESARIDVSLRVGLALADRGDWRQADASFVEAELRLRRLMGEVSAATLDSSPMYGAKVPASNSPSGIPTIDRLRRRLIELTINRWNALRLMGNSARLRPMIQEGFDLLGRGTDLPAIDANELRASLLMIVAAEAGSDANFARATRFALEATEIRRQAAQEIETPQTLDRLARALEGVYIHAYRAGHSGTAQHLSEAIQTYRRAYEQYNDGEAERGLARCLRRRVESKDLFWGSNPVQDISDAIGHLSKLVLEGITAAQSDLADALVAAARVYSEMGDLKSAQTNIENALHHFREVRLRDGIDGQERSAHALLFSARLFLKQDAPEHALDRLREASEQIYLARVSFEKMQTERNWLSLLLMLEIRFYEADALARLEREGDAWTLLTTIAEQVEIYDEAADGGPVRHRRIAAELFGRVRSKQAELAANQGSIVAACNYYEDGLRLIYPFIAAEDEVMILLGFEIFLQYYRLNTANGLAPQLQIYERYMSMFSDFIK